MLYEKDSALHYRYDAEQFSIESWGENAFRVRATKMSSMPCEDWALNPPLPSNPTISVTETEGTIQNGKIKATMSKRGKVMIHNSKGELLLEEYARTRKNVLDPKCSAIEIEAREFKPIPGGDYHLTMRFESVSSKEKIFGMGQYQQDSLDLKGHDLELAHRNSQASVPFALSSLGYGFLGNNPGIGRAFLGKNIMTFEAYSTKVLDYWVVAGDTPAEIEEAYGKAAGTVPMMPQYGLGFWQYAMVKELQDLNIELMVSVWPTVDTRSENYEEMLEKGYLIRTDRGMRIGMDFEGNTIHYDSTNPEARAYLWEKAKTNYYSKGIKVFWLDEAEPEYSCYDFDKYRYHLGPNLAIGNIYPREYARTFYEGMEAAGQKKMYKQRKCPNRQQWLLLRS